MTSGSSGIETATKRLSVAIDALAAAVERRHEADRAEASLAEQLHRSGNDRSRLTVELDSAIARSRRLQEMNREIARRLEVAIDTVRVVLEGKED